MIKIGITGGVGAGKSRVIEYLKEHTNSKILLADEVAHLVKEPETPGYHELVKLLGEDILGADGEIDRKKMAARIFEDKTLLNEVNNIIHPRVKDYIFSSLEKEEAAGKTDVFFVEAALLIEAGYLPRLDELWYIHSRNEVRVQRLKKSRNYSEEKIRQIMDSQLKEEEFRRHADVVIDNSDAFEDTCRQLEREGKRLKIWKERGRRLTVERTKNYGGQLVFGLDIGTRSVVGTVGYKDGERFIVVAQKVKEHETRAMLDGQIHDIEKVGATIRQVKEALEQEIGRRLAEVCIAAAGRVLETITSHADIEFEEEQPVTKEDIFALNSAAVEKAYESFLRSNQSAQRFYCVGNSVICYYLNDFHISNLENHKARKISVDLIATFLPDEVVDGLNKAVELAGLQVANMTLEPIAAIQVAIPERYRLLNIALVDVGAGTSDISITRDGSIIGYGMIPKAGDCLTEQIALHCLTDFQMAESIKKDSTRGDIIGYEDIMGIKQTIETTEIDEVLEPVLDDMTSQVADKIKELNGGKSVSAVFVVGGGGKVNHYTHMLAEKLGIQQERVAIRGPEVMQKIEFTDPTIEKDSLLVTPVGICMNFYEQNNNFVFVSFNGQKVKLYDNKHLTITDAAIQAQFPNDGFFPKRGKELNFTVNGKKKIVRGDVGEGAVILLNGRSANIHSMIKKDDIIEVEESTAGLPAHMEIRELPEYKSSLTVEINGKKVILPKFASVNGTLQSEFYEIQNQDVIEFLNYYTVEQILTFMDVSGNVPRTYFVNNAVADLGTRVYENFTVTLEEKSPSFEQENPPKEEEGSSREKRGSLSDSSISERENHRYSGMVEIYDQLEDDKEEEDTYAGNRESDRVTKNRGNGGVFQGVSWPTQQGEMTANAARLEKPLTPPPSRQMIIVVNQSPVVLRGKAKYIFVDVFDYISFDLSKPQGAIVTTLNGKPAQFMEELHDGDVLEIYWRSI